MQRGLANEEQTRLAQKPKMKTTLAGYLANDYLRSKPIDCKTEQSCRHSQRSKT